MNERIVRIVDLGSAEVRFSYFGDHWRCEFNVAGTDEFIDVEGRGETPEAALDAALNRAEEVAAR